MSEPEPHLLVERTDDDIVIATMNRPKARNTVSFDMWDGFAALFDEMEGGSPVRALILRGAGGYFSGGGDIKTAPERGEGAQKRAKRLEMGQRTIQRLIALPAPTIAAVEGGAMGIGWGIALACDVLIAGDGAQFGAPFLKIGLAPDGGTAWQLVRQLGRRRASEIIYSGRTVGASEALGLGLASRLVPDGEAVAASLEFARGMGEGHREATELTKRLIHLSEESTLAASLPLELSFCHTLMAGEELLAARAAFIARSAARKAKG
jgi:enoyl-CoA hydratase/carnithine racemase